MSCAGGSQKKKKKKREAAVRKESVGTQECEACHQNDMGVDVEQWHEPIFMCDRQCRTEGYKFCEIASMIVEDDGEPHT